MTDFALKLKLNRQDITSLMFVRIQAAVIAGWTGRDRAVVENHIVELEAIGVQRPASVPVFYRASAARLTTADAIEVLGESSSGEVEFVLLQHGGQLWLGAGSDHTDRLVERYDIRVSKQMCDKPVAGEFWAFDDIAPHWEALLLRSYMFDGNAWTLYQEGSVTSILEPHVLIQSYLNGASQSLNDGTVMFCGTLPARGGIRAAARFEFEIEDPVLHRKIKHRYEIRTLPIV